MLLNNVLGVVVTMRRRARDSARYGRLAEHSLQNVPAAERRCSNFKDFYLKAKARIRPGLPYASAFRSTAASFPPSSIACPALPISPYSERDFVKSPRSSSTGLSGQTMRRRARDSARCERLAECSFTIRTYIT